ncbi:PAAR domain-containing protein [Burkholderia sp. JSH-S8]|nr:PAAR domain-containing protein [Burkholderia sp. JSH-S8]
MFPAARKNDPTDHGGRITTGTATVTINRIPAAAVHVSDAECSLHPGKQTVIGGSTTVFIEGAPATMKTGKVSCGAQIASGSPDVSIGS